MADHLLDDLTQQTAQLTELGGALDSLEDYLQPFLGATPKELEGQVRVSSGDGKKIGGASENCLLVRQQTPIVPDTTHVSLPPQCPASGDAPLTHKQKQHSCRRSSARARTSRSRKRCCSCTKRTPGCAASASAASTRSCRRR